MRDRNQREQKKMTALWGAFKPVWGWWALMLIFLTPQGGQSAETARRFLSGLRERGYHDMAVEYLEQMRTSPLSPVEFRETLHYELGVTLIEASRDQRDLKQRESQLDEAANALQRFVGMNPDHPLVTSANSQLGNLRVERARIRVEQANQPAARDRRDSMLAEANQLYGEALTVFQRAQAELRERLEQMANIPSDDRRAIELRDTLRTEYLQSQLLAAAVKEETADTVSPQSEEYESLLTEAAEWYHQIYKKYGSWLAGLYARMYEGRCQQKLGNYEEALRIFGELFEQPDDPEEFRTFKTRTYQLALACWEETGQHAEAVERLAPWVDGARPNEAREEDWQELRLGLARAQWAMAQEVRAETPRDPAVRRMESEARRNAQLVSRTSRGLQQEARQFLAEIGIEAREADEEAADPTSFAEARQAGRDALDALQTANLLLQTLPPRIRREQDAEVRQELEQQLETAQQTAGTAVDEALHMFRLALELADEYTDVRDLNVVRYFLCFLYHTTERYMDAAVVGEFLARRYPESPGARQAAKIAMAAWLKLYEAAGGEREFETGQVIEIAQYIARRWPEQDEGMDALKTLIPLMIRAGDLDAAQGYLEQIPEERPERGDAEITTGQAMWGAYLRGVQQWRAEVGDQADDPQDEAQGARREELAELKERAQQILVKGVARMQEAGKASPASLAAALSLAQLYLDTGQTDESLALLEDPQIGPLTLVRQEDPAAARDGLATETYKTALRAYISSLPHAGDADAVVAQASEIMDAMRDAMEPTELIAIYFSLARDLESQMALASAENRQALSKGFETFLLRLRGSSSDFAVLNWVAETFLGMGTSFDTERRPSEDAIRYYRLAEETYQQILENGVIEDERMTVQLRLRLADVLRRLNRFTAARDIFVDILQGNPGMINVQMQAARLYQDWASFPGREDLYLRSIQGAELDPATQRPILWGWQGIATRTANNAQFRAVFHEARYNLAASLHRLAMAKEGEERERYLQMAGRTIRQTQQLFGTGDEWEEWRPEFDTLLKQIQKTLGEDPVGLEARSVAQAD